jgi:hypothetical protein
MTQVIASPRHSLRVAIILTVVVGAIATVVAYLGTRENPQAPVTPATAPVADTSLPVDTIALPHDEPELPAGPYQRTFAVSCTVCHSTRLVMTQPFFSRETWEEVVHKMVKNYGASIAPEAEAQIVNYLITVRGK